MPDYKKEFAHLKDRYPDATAVHVGHGYYDGCDSGCCGTALFVSPEEEQVAWTFAFKHDYEARFDEAKALAEVLGVPFIDRPEDRKIVKECW